MKKKIGKIVALFIAAGLLVNSFFLAAANEGDSGAGESAQEIQESEHTHSWGEETVAELPLLAGGEVTRITFRQMLPRVLRIACLVE
mgnify:CR=1 FL=1